MIPPYESQKALLLSNSDITHGGTATASWDCQGGDYAVIDIALGSEANTSGTGPTISIEHSDDATTYATVVADRTAEDVTNERLLSYYVDLRGKKRYLKVSITVPDGNTNSNLTVGSAVGTLTRLTNGPSSTTGMLANTSEQVAVVVG